MREGRWTTVTESDFDHEHRGLETIRERLPDTGVWRAWSNFTFTAGSGHVREVDLLVLSPSGLHMVELKSWRGSVTTENGSWVQTRPNGSRQPHSNPRHLVEQKAKELAGLLRQQGVQGVYVSGSVCFTDSSLRLRLPANDQNGVHFVSSLLEMLQRPPYDVRRRITGPRATGIANGLKQVGIHRSDAQFKVGPYLLDRKPIDTGPTWVDHLARHTELDEQVRVRVYLVERGASAAMKRSVENAARRESDVLTRFQHPGVVRVKTYDPSGHRSGPTLVFEHHLGTLRLDEYLIQHGDRLDILTRMSLVRQLAETVRSAHSRRIHHRTLSAHSVHVLPGKGKGGGEDARWLAPRLQVSDWQVALRRTSPDETRRFASTSLSLGHVSDKADAYLAPELTASRPDPVHLDVYGLGVLTYLLATGRAPAASQAELLTQLEAGEGLRPSALVDGLSQDIDELVQLATAYRPEQRLASVDEFLDILECVEDSLTAPGTTSDVPRDPEQDPLDAMPGDVLEGRWEVQRQLGTGSTSRAFLVRDLTVDPRVRNARPLAVLKVALSDNRGQILAREAEILSGLRLHQGIIRLVEPGPLTIGGRTVLALEYVGDERPDEERGSSRGAPRRREETVARQLREGGRLKVDQLEAYGDYLFGAMDFLEGEGVWHRDIKPDNIAVRVRPNRTRELVLIDFSLAGYPAKEKYAGTEGYLDPFIGGLKRSVYDNHAERYAIAVTLHEMASGELPRWGDGSVVPAQTDPEEWPYPEIAAEAFDPAVREGLKKFFRKALHRDATKRFPDLKPMRDRWRKIFLDAQTRPSSGHPLTRPPETTAAPAFDGTNEADEAAPALRIPDAEPLTAEQQREEQARAATHETHLSTAGLSPTAESFLYDLGITTVGELLDHSQRKFLNAPGLGAKTRSEIQRRQREWGERLRRTPDSPLTPEGRKKAEEELERSSLESALTDCLVEHDSASTLPGGALRSVSLDALATVFVPKPNNNGSNRNSVEAVRLLLRLPDEQGELPEIGVWPMQKNVAKALGPSAGSISRAIKEQRKRWKKLPAVQALRDEVLGLLEELGRIASAAEIADALTVRRGTQLRGREQRRALALAAVRAVVEVEQLVPEEAAFRHQANRKAKDEGMSAGLLALEVGEDDSPDTPSAPGLLDYATRLGRAADRLSKLDTLPTTAAVLAELGAIDPPPGTVEWNERRLVEVAAAASTNAAVTPRLEIYPRDLSLVRALRLAQAGLVRLIPGPLLWENQPGLTPDEVHERVRARFPELVDAHGNRELPVGGPLTKALKDAGFGLELSTRRNTGTLRYLPPKESAESSYLTMVGQRRTTRTSTFTRYSDDPQLAAALRSEEQLLAAARGDGFRVLTVRAGMSASAVEELSGAGSRFGARAVSVTGLFLGAMHELVDPKPKLRWETVLRADAAEPGSRSARNFANYVTTAWGRVEPRLRELLALDGGGAKVPVLMTDTGVFARYDAMDVLHRLAEVSRQGGSGLWMLCPQDDPARDPRIGAVAVPYQAGLGEWIQLPDSWAKNEHRARA